MSDFIPNYDASNIVFGFFAPEEGESLIMCVSKEQKSHFLKMVEQGGLCSTWVEFNPYSVESLGKSRYEEGLQYRNNLLDSEIIVVSSDSYFAYRLLLIFKTQITPITFQIAMEKVVKDCLSDALEVAKAKKMNTAATKPLSKAYIQHLCDAEVQFTMGRPSLHQNWIGFLADTESYLRLCNTISEVEPLVAKLCELLKHRIESDDRFKSISSAQMQEIRLLNADLKSEIENGFCGAKRACSFASHEQRLKAMATLLWQKSEGLLAVYDGIVAAEARAKVEAEVKAKAEAEAKKARALSRTNSRSALLGLPWQLTGSREGVVPGADHRRLSDSFKDWRSVSRLSAQESEELERASSEVVAVAPSEQKALSDVESRTEKDMLPRVTVIVGKKGECQITKNFKEESFSNYFMGLFNENCDPQTPRSTCAEERRTTPEVPRCSSSGSV